MKLRYLCWWLLAGILGWQPVIAQESSAPEAKLAAAFSFRQLNGGVVVVKARLDDFSDTLQFILDTGSGGISLDSGTAHRYKLPLEDSRLSVKGIGGTKPLRFYKAGTLHFPGLEVSALDFHINDYELLSEVYGFHVDGIIGFSFLRRYIVSVDYDQNKIYVYEPGPFSYPKKGCFLKTSIPSIPVTTQAVMDSRRVDARLFFDIGAGLCLLFSEQFERDSLLLEAPKKIVRTQVEGIAGKITMRFTTLRRLRIENFRFRQVPLHLYEDDVNVLNYPSVVGLIGNDLLRRFNQVINYPAQTIHLTPNTHFTEPFDYSYTGMNYYFIDGKVTVTDIQAESPASKAGFLPGDILLGVDNRFSNDIQEYKSMLQQAGARLRVLIWRNGQLLQLKLKVGSIRKGI